MSTSLVPVPIKRSILVGFLALLVVVLGVLIFGVNPLYVAGVLLLVTLSVVLWVLIQVRRDKLQLMSEVHSLETSAILLTERVRVAREVHDLVSHGLGMITVRASSASYLATQGHGVSLSNREDELLAALADIERVSREATGGLRQTILSLRDPDEGAWLTPVETLAALPDVLRAAQAAGLVVTYHAGEMSEVPVAVQTAIVVLVREGLANAARHAGPTDVTVVLSQEEGVVKACVKDSGPSEDWQAKSGTGHGLIGLRERITAVGGSLHAGPRDEGRGYELKAIFTVGGA
ncbi:histidine kinase [Jonesiaceae bacterium BS-20]|uniref:histidine kinase n=1 Tax=Jonesiaceae bacterium BS-20 TaxID=3120821 RepID=A0AAU7DU69_9MICO